jgi:hypothetical protein
VEKKVLLVPRVLLGRPVPKVLLGLRVLKAPLVPKVRLVLLDRRLLSAGDLIILEVSVSERPAAWRVFFYLVHGLGLAMCPSNSAGVG